MLYIDIIFNTLEQVLIFLPLVFAIYLSYEILVLTDLTVGATFVFGAAVFAKLLTVDINQYVAMMIALIGATIIGALVAAMQYVAKINSLIAGILAVFMLYSINLIVMGRSNIGLLNNEHLILSYLQNTSTTALLLSLVIFIIIITLLFTIFLHSRIGLRMRAFGVNPYLLSKLGYRHEIYLTIGLAVSNVLAAISGIMTSQVNGFADVHMGDGMALVAIGAVVIGCQLCRSLFVKQSGSFKAIVDLSCCFIGTYIYFIIVNILLAINIDPIYLKLILGLFLVFSLSTASYSRNKGDYHGELDQIR